MDTKKYKIIVIIGLLLLIFTSCEKSSVDFPRSYVFDSSRTGEINVYTNSGKVTDQQSINKSISGYEQVFWKPGHQTNYGITEIDILSESKAKVVSTDTTRYFDLIHKNGIIYFQAHDTVIGNDGFGLFDIIRERTKYSPLFIKPVAESIGIGYSIIPCLYIAQSNHELQIPIMSFIEKNYGNNGDLISKYGIGSINNVINPDYLNKIRNDPYMIDTIICQDNKVIFKEK